MKSTFRKLAWLIPRLIFAFLIFVILSAGSLNILDKLYPPDLHKLNDWSLQIDAKNHDLLRAFLSNDQKWRFKADFKQIPQLYIDLLLNYEDRKFYQHDGVDFGAILRATWQNITSHSVVSGASTITMQLAKLLNPRPRTLRSKVIEAFRAWQIERRYSKQEILAFYSSVVPMGSNIEGIATASRYYFNKNLENLTLSEIAWLIALPQSPNYHNPIKYPKRALAARNKILTRAYEANIISEDAYKRAIAVPLSINLYPLPFLAPHYSEDIKQALANKDSKAIFNGINYDISKSTITTEIDYSLQKQIENILKLQLIHRHKKENLAVAIIDNQTGAPIAYSGGAFFDNNRLGQVDILQSIRSPGSTLKPFIYLYTFEWLNYHPLTTIYDIPIRIGDYHPHDYSRKFLGEVTLAQALQLSLNIPAVKLLNKITPESFVKQITKEGLTLFLPKGGTPNITIALGGVGVKALDLLHLYSRLANCTFTTDTLASNQSCWYVTHILQHSADSDGRIYWGAEPVAFKTGTSYGWRDQWVFAYTNKYSIVVWSGRADGRFAEAKSGSQSVVPILRNIIAILPQAPSQWFETKPQWIFDINQATRLPLRLRSVEKTNTINQLHIASPIDNSTVEIDQSINGENLPISINVLGGAQPYLLIINDKIITSFRDSYSWESIKPGTYEIEIVDQNGGYTKSTIIAKAKKVDIIPRAKIETN